MPASKKTRKRRFFLWTMAVLILLLSLGWLYYQSRFSWCQRKVRYPAFGISLPTGYLIHGIDVSRYQKNIDWNAVAEMKIRSVRMDFGFVKATEGVTYTDPLFKRNWQSMERTRMVRGDYHYFKPSLDGNKQADHFIRQVDLRPGDLPPVLDVEELDNGSPAQLVEGVRKWIDRVEQHYKVKPVIYAGADFYNKYLFAHFSKYPLWVAHYYQPCEPRVLSGWKFWQHNDRGRINGIAAPVDFNVFHGSRESFDALRIKRTIP